MGSLEPPDKEELPGSKLLEDYEKYRAKRSFAPLMAGGATMLVLAAATLYEFGAFGTSYLLAAESLVLVFILTTGLLLSISGLAFWLMWQFASRSVEKGHTRPAARHVLTYVGIVFGFALPIGFAGGLSNQDLGRGLLWFFLVFWNLLACGILGYCGQFMARGKKLF